MKSCYIYFQIYVWHNLFSMLSDCSLDKRELDIRDHRYQSATPLVNIIQYLQTFRQNAQNPCNSYDVVISCNDGKVKAHQLILATISPILHQEFCKNKYDDNIYIYLPDFSVDEMKLYLDCLYIGSDLSKYHDLNQLFNFKFVSQNNDLKNNANESELKQEESFDDETISVEAANFCKVDMKNEMSQRSEKRKKRSKVWQHFVIDPANTQQCICNICLEKVPYLNSGTSAMMQHLEFHKNGNFNAKPPDGTRRKRSKAWEYYVIDPSNGAQCICQICKEPVSYQNGGTSAMISHLKVDHDISITTIIKKNPPLKKEKIKVKKEPALDPETGMIRKNMGKSRKKRRKDIWQHFDHFADNNLRAKCRICQEDVELKDKSSVSQTLVKHLNTHGIKLEMETCSICGKMFDEKNKRRKHENNHQVKCSCSYCGKHFSDNTARIVHERTHTGEKPFQCSQCGKKFGQRTQLQTHMRVHTGETPYHCDICGQRWKHLSSRNNHKCLKQNNNAQQIVNIQSSTPQQPSHLVYN